MPVNILDLSYYDGRDFHPEGTSLYYPVDWSKARTKWGGAIVRSSQGLTTDPLYSKQIEAMRANNVPWGSYHYFQAEIAPEGQVNTLVNKIMASGGFGALGVWIDVEENRTGMNSLIFLYNLQSLLTKIRSSMASIGVSVPLGIYTRASFIDPIWTTAGKPAWISTFPCWQAYFITSWTNYAWFYDQIVHQGSYPTLGIKPPLAMPKVVALQWTHLGQPVDVPGYPPYKLALDFNIWFNFAPHQYTEAEQLKRLWDYHPELH